MSSQLVFTKAYDQMSIRGNFTLRTAIWTGFVSCEKTVLYLGRRNEPAALGPLLSTMLQGLNAECLFLQFDDVIVYGQSVDELRQHL